MSEQALPIAQSTPNTIATPAVRTVVGIIGVVAATVLGAQIRIPLPFTPVPITMQAFAVLLGAALLGRHRGAIAQLTYLALGSFGLPIFAGSAAALAPYLFGPTGGYLVGFVLASLFVGYAASKHDNYSTLQLTGIFSVGMALIFVCGLVHLGVWTQSGLQQTLLLGFVPFVPGSIIKIALAVPIYKRLQQPLRRYFN